jgi:hypothetical protein
MGTTMPPLVDVVGGDRLLADQAVDTALAPITDVFDFHGGDIVTDSGHALMIGETAAALNYSNLGPQTINGEWQLGAHSGHLRCWHQRRLSAHSGRS